MGLHVDRSVRIAAVALASVCAAACATVEPRYAARNPGIGGRGDRAPPAAIPGARGTDRPYQVGGIWFVPHDQPNYDERGIASWYGDAFNMKPTATGELFDMDAISAAHTTLPLPCVVEVTNLDNGRKLKVRVNDRGPFVGDRIIDLSHAAARELGYDRAGLAHVRVRYLGPAPLAGPSAGVRYAQARSAPPPPAAPPPAPPVVRAAAEPSSRAIPELPEGAPTPAPPTVVVAQTVPPPASLFRIQAGAFSDPLNAQRAATQLAVAGAAVIEPMQRDGVTLYRVILAGPADEAEAFALRDRVAQIGFADARVVRPF